MCTSPSSLAMLISQQDNTSGRALFLALPREFRLRSAGLVPQLVFSHLDLRLLRRGHLHAAADHLNTVRSHKSASHCCIVFDLLKPSF
jgi:hypothetical protein